MSITVSATKPTPTTKLGLAYVINDRVKVTGLSEGALLSTTGLEVGQEIITINGTHVEGETREVVKSILASVESDITITARLQPFVLGCRDVVKKPHPSNPRLSQTAIVYDMSAPRNDLPAMLKTVGVPLYKWKKMHDAVREELIPALTASDEVEQMYQAEMKSYTSKQMIKGGLVGFGTESEHEKKTYHMVHQCAELTNNANLIALDISTYASGMLAQYGIVCRLDLQERELPRFSSKQGGLKKVNVPRGLKFMSIE